MKMKTQKNTSVKLSLLQTMSRLEAKTHIDQVLLKINATSDLLVSENYILALNEDEIVEEIALTFNSSKSKYFKIFTQNYLLLRKSQNSDLLSFFLMTLMIKGLL